MLPLIPLVATGAAIYGVLKFKGWYDEIKAEQIEIIGDNANDSVKDIFLSPNAIVGEMFDKLREKMPDIEEAGRHFIDNAFENSEEEHKRKLKTAVTNLVEELNFSNLYEPQIADEIEEFILQGLPLDGSSTIAMLLELHGNQAAKESLEKLRIKHREVFDEAVKKLYDEMKGVKKC